MDKIKTADLCDRYAGIEHFQIAEPLLQSYGGHGSFWGQIITLKVFEDNVLVRQTLQNPGQNKVLVIDGGGSHRCALIGDNLAQLAIDNGWSGLIVYGCVRDSAALREMPIGIRALHTHPLQSHKRGIGEKDILITFAAVNFRSGHYVYVDEDGIIVSQQALN